VQIAGSFLLRELITIAAFVDRAMRRRKVVITRGCARIRANTQTQSE
jgi:hypothetical protein